MDAIKKAYELIANKTEIMREGLKARIAEGFSEGDAITAVKQQFEGELNELLNR